MQRLHFLLDIAWLGLLVFYVLGGTNIVPFHGDESTIIWTSKDYAYIFLNDNLDRVKYSETPVDASEQQLRLLNGSLTRYLISFSWHLDGYTVEDINEQWHWGFDWQWNLDNGHIPTDALLMLSRWPSSLLLAGGCIAMFLIGCAVAGRPVGYVASLYFTLNPALLLNGRRAMLEGALVFFILMTLLAGIWLLRYRTWWATLLLGVCAGLAVSAKHTGVLTVAVVFFASGIYALYYFRHERRVMFQMLIRLLVAGMLSVMVFFILHPVWWGNPLERTEQVLDERQALLDTQVDLFGGYQNFSERINGFWTQVFIVKPQYYEADEWAIYIADQINTYENSFWRGVSIGVSAPGAIVLFFLCVVGLWSYFYRAYSNLDAAWLVGIWAFTVLFITAVITPVQWQRYYLPAYLAVGVLSASGVVYVGEKLFDGIRSYDPAKLAKLWKAL